MADKDCTGVVIREDREDQEDQEDQEDVRGKKEKEPHVNTEAEQPTALLTTVLDEIRKIRAGVVAAHASGRLSTWDDADTNEEYLQEVFANHKEL